MKHLQEFYPQNRGLLGLNVNRGAAIKIRLRQAHDQSSFFPYEEHILGTMVHELTHMVESSHSSRFYKLMDDLCDEVDKDRAGASSYPTSTFMPFVGTGAKLGTHSSSSSSSSSSALPTTAAGRRQLMANAAVHRYVYTYLYEFLCVCVFFSLCDLLFRQCVRNSSHDFVIIIIIITSSF